MPSLRGLFDSFDNLDQLNPESVAAWIKPVPATEALENYLANKILYPQSLPLTQYDMQIDLAILREALKLNGPQPKPQNPLLGDNPFLNITMRKMLIPLSFLKFVPDLTSLVKVFIDALLLSRAKEDYFQDLWTIVLTDDQDEVIGSILLPQFENEGGLMNLAVQDKVYQIRPGILTIIPCQKDRCKVAYKMQKGKILGKSESAVEVYGGKLGLVVDGRK